MQKRETQNATRLESTENLSDQFRHTSPIKLEKWQMFVSLRLWHIMNFCVIVPCILYTVSVLTYLFTFRCIQGAKKLLA